MGTLTDSLFSVLMGWVRGLVNALWALFSSNQTTALEFFGKNWLLIAAVMIAAGLVIDWIIWLLRWQPYHLWAQRARRLLHLEEPEEETPPARAHAAALPQKRETGRRAQERIRAVPDEEEGEAEYGAEYGAAYDAAYDPDEQAEQWVMEQAQHAPDEYAYPGMRYDSAAPERGSLAGTQRYGAVTQEGPGAAEVARRKAEIEAWQQQMQEEAQARARAQRTAYEAEQARLVKEAREQEQARQAQAEYERQMAEYERQCAQYERDLKEYERQKAAYDAQMAREALRQEQAGALTPGLRRRRGAQAADGDGVPEDTKALAPQGRQAADRAGRAPAETRKNRLADRVSRMMEPEEETLAVRTKLPPRVDMKDAYRPAATPGQPARRFNRDSGENP